jgi:hypothetical protein
MLRHIVMWKLKEHAEGADRAVNARRLKEKLESCAALPGVIKYEVALAQPGLEATYDVVLYAVFRTRCLPGSSAASCDQAVHRRREAGAAVHGLRGVTQ